MKKSKIILGAFCFLWLCACGVKQKSNVYVIQGQVSNLPDSSLVYLDISYDDNNQFSDTTYVVKGAFTLQDTSAVSRKVRLNILYKSKKDNQRLSVIDNLFITPGDTLKVEGDFHYNINAYGSYVHDIYKEYKNISIDEERCENTPEYQIAIIEKVKHSIFQKIDSFAYSHPESPVYLNYLEDKLDAFKEHYVTSDSIKSHFKHCEKYQKRNNRYKGLLAKLNNKLKVIPGNKGVDIPLYDTLGNKKQLSDFRGKVIVLYFTSVNSAECEILEKRLRKFRQMYNHKDLVFIPIYNDHSEQDWRDKSKAESLWPFYTLYTSDYKSADRIKEIYCVDKYPSVFIINKDFTIVEDQSFPEAGKKVCELLGQEYDPSVENYSDEFDKNQLKLEANLQKHIQKHVKKRIKELKAKYSVSDKI
ncbi:MAG: thioredoxin-like domain-containing protein [Bacteroidales bacterium]